MMSRSVLALSLVAVALARVDNVPVAANTALNQTHA
jgi:hypothetical protein